MQCVRCTSPYLRDDDHDTVCTSCGLIQPSGDAHLSSDEGVWITFGSIFEGRIIQTHTLPEKYRENYFKESNSFVLQDGMYYRSLPTDVLEDIYDQIENEERFRDLKKKFINDPNKYNTQKILGSVIVKDQEIAERYKKKNGRLLKKYTQKNFNIKWKSLTMYLIDMYQLPVRYTFIPYDVFDIISHVHTYITSQYTKLIRYAKMSDTRYTSLKGRVALPNARVFFVLLLLVLNPALVTNHLDIICLPKENTVKKALTMIKDLLDYTYTTNIFKTLRNMVLDTTLELYGGDHTKVSVQYLFFLGIEGTSVKFFSNDIKHRYFEELECLKQRIQSPIHFQTLDKMKPTTLYMIVQFITDLLT